MKSIKKAIAAAAFIAPILFTNSAGAAPVQDQAINIIINGETQKFDSEPLISDGRVLVPMRGVFEKLGATIDWDEQNQTATVAKGDLKVKVEVGSSLAVKNGDVINLDVKPLIQDKRVMVPLRFISEALGAKVNWNEETKTAEIIDNTADDSNKQSDETTVLTYQKATEMALRHSYDLTQKQLALTKAEDAYDDVDIPLGTYNAKLIESKQSLQTSMEWAEKQVQMQKDIIAYEVVNDINSINLLKREIAVTDLQNSIAQEKLSIAETQAQYGLESKYNVSTLENNQKQLDNQKKVLQISLDDAWLKLRQLLGINSNETYPTEENIVYQPLKDININSLVSEQLNENPNIWYYNEQIDNAKLGLALYEFNNESESYTAKQIDVSAAQNNLNIYKASLENQLRSTFNQIKELEENYNKLQLQLDQAKKDLEMAQAKFALGLVKELDVKDAQLNVEQLNLELKKTAVQHEQLVKLLDKPYLGGA